MHASLITLCGSFPCLNVGNLFLKSMDVLCEVFFELFECCNYVLSLRIICICLIHAERRMRTCELCALRVDGCYRPDEHVCLFCMNFICAHSVNFHDPQVKFRDLWLE